MAHFYKKFNFLKCRYSEIFTKIRYKNDCHGRNKPAIFVCLLCYSLSGIADLE
nr:MAG TPA: hypothetical protein [Caudoviricetes sp.]